MTVENSTNPLISIIIPVYNTEEFLDICIESVVAQTYHNLEILLIDDGSTDSCAQKADAWVQKDSRIKVVHQKNQGLSVSRNHGLELAQGDFIAFVDSDDFIHPQMYEALFQAITAENADIAQCRYQEFESVTELSAPNLQTDSVFHLDKTLTRNEYLPGFWNAFTRATYAVAWNKLYRRSLLSSIDAQFLPNYLSEDAYFNTDVFCAAQKITFLSDTFYYYRQRENSLRFQYMDKFLIHRIRSVAYHKNQLDKVLPADLLPQNAYKLLNYIADETVKYTIWKQTNVCREVRRTFCELYAQKRSFKKKPLEEMKLFLARFCYPVYFALKYPAVNKRLHQ